ncbi:fucolectin-3-like isoform X1 [Colossoma macropomum]|uniref:fucolectin-3-like isoform X1 n=1 Tax=Colossoma macropomum TaxID=42526 RepID=UPI001864EE39|nr:fucolectin-3-like isoform X1 [Colossoma macropomum]
MILHVFFLLSLLSVSGLSASTENLAAGAKAVQSSTYDHLGDAQNAVDGDNNPDYLQSSCSHTHSDVNPWWRVELPAIYNVTSVTITNRGDCCGDRINGAQIRIGNSLKNNGNDNKLVAVIGPLGSDVTKTYRFRATEGQYVNIFLPGENKILTLCEVKVFADEEFSPEPLYLQDKDDLNNIALRGRATQSSIHSSEISPGFGLALNAIDGNRNPDLKKGSCMRTEQESAPWWRLSLTRKHIVSSVALTNRGDCCPELLDGAEIRVGDSLKNNGKDNPLCATVSSIPAGQTEHFNCSALLEGSYVTVSLPREGTLSLCEVEVFGVPVVRCGD